VTLAVEVVRHQGGWAPSELSDRLFERAAQAALQVAAIPPGSYQVTLVLTGDEEMTTLNRTWRGKDAPTNVLSFPSGEDDASRFLGDVVLAAGTTQREAHEQAIALEDHVSHLVVHGVLHLLGFDHIDEEQAERMEDLERAALASLGIADPYADQNAARSAEVSP
jgi:probable rRNA maturation factor